MNGTGEAELIGAFRGGLSGARNRHGQACTAQIADGFSFQMGTAEHRTLCSHAVENLLSVLLRGTRKELRLRLFTLGACLLAGGLQVLFQVFTGRDIHLTGA